jgi:predicted PurR-regulated permease PerM
VTEAGGPDPARSEAGGGSRGLGTAEQLGLHLYKAIGLAFVLALLFRYFDAVSRVLLIAFVGVILGIAFNALAIRIPLRRGYSVALIAVGTLAAIAAGVWFGVTLLFEQIRAFAEDMPSLVAGLEEWEDWLEERTGLDLELIGPHLQSGIDRFFGGVDGAAVVAGAFGVLELLAITILVLVGAFFTVAEPNEGLLSPVMRSVPLRRRPAFQRMFTRMGTRLAQWLWGTAIAMFIVGALAIGAFWFLGTPYPVLLGVIIGITNVVPLVGPWIGGIAAVVVTLVVDPGLTVWVIVAILAIQEVESNLVRPFVMKGAANVHPFATLLALLLFSSMFGLLGAVLSLPLLLVIGTAVEVLWVEESLGAAGDRIEPVVDE